ncbi:MAG: enoyl-CoA hydratase/isomerase family protein [Chloroflexi bacterium]|nr:enoyl-CoA hydratase/isomerase family protein [Chloroflexota bacterium]
MGEVILKEKREHVLVLTLNRPEALNCFNFELVNAFESAVRESNFDLDVRAIVITGAPGSSQKQSFSTGADLVERRTMSVEQVKRFVHAISAAFIEVDNARVPVIAAINGFAFGGGLEVALACDIRLCSTAALLGLTETSLAVIPGAGGTQRLPRIIGVARAKEMIYTAKRISAQEALALGLVSQVVEPDRLLPAALEIASRIAKNGPVAVQQAKFAINKGTESSLDIGLKIESNAYLLTIPTEDRLEGLSAFKEKRDPVYKGK